MGSTYTIPPSIEQQQKANRDAGSSVPIAVISLLGCAAFFWLAHRNNLHALHPLPTLAGRFHQIQIPLMELAAAVGCGIAFIVSQLRPAEDTGSGSVRRGISRNTRTVLWYGSILLIATCMLATNAAMFLSRAAASILGLATAAGLILLLFTSVFANLLAQKTRIGAAQSAAAGRRPLVVSNALLFLVVVIFAVAIAFGAGRVAERYFPDHRAVIVHVASLAAAVLGLFAYLVLARKPGAEPGPSTLQDAEGHDTREGFRRRLVQAAGLCVYVLALIAVLHFPAAREFRGLIYAGQFVVIVVYVRGVNSLRRRILFLSRNGKYDSALQLNRFVSLLPLGGGSIEGIILFEQGRYRDALAYLRPLAFDATGNPRLASMELYCYALSLVNDGRPADAEPLLDAAVKASPEKDALKVALAGCLLTEEKDPERARSLLEQVMAGPGHARLTGSDKAHRIARYAWALAACGRRSEAQQQIDAALAAGQSLSPGDLAGVYYFVGEAWRALRETRKARDAFGKALELRPDGPAATGVQKALAKLNSDPM